MRGASFSGHNHGVSVTESGHLVRPRQLPSSPKASPQLHALQRVSADADADAVIVPRGTPDSFSMQCNQSRVHAPVLPLPSILHLPSPSIIPSHPSTSTSHTSPPSPRRHTSHLKQPTRSAAYPSRLPSTTTAATWRKMRQLTRLSQATFFSRRVSQSLEPLPCLTPLRHEHASLRTACVWWCGAVHADSTRAPPPPLRTESMHAVVERLADAEDAGRGGLESFDRGRGEGGVVDMYTA